MRVNLLSDYGITEFLENKKFLKEYKEFSKGLTSESLDFLEDYSILKSHAAKFGKKHETTQGIMRSLYWHYIVSSGGQPLNISNFSKQRLNKENSQEIFKLRSFEKIETIVLALISRDSYFRFRKTPEYEKFKLEDTRTEFKLTINRVIDELDKFNKNLSKGNEKKKEMLFAFSKLELTECRAVVQEMKNGLKKALPDISKQSLNELQQKKQKLIQMISEQCKKIREIKSKKSSELELETILIKALKELGISGMALEGLRTPKEKPRTLVIEGEGTPKQEKKNKPKKP